MNKKRFTKKYPVTGIITLDAAAFPGISQETIDREIRSFEPFSTAVDALYEYENSAVTKKLSKETQNDKS